MPGWTFDRTGGHLAVDFANTVSHRTHEPIERLATYDDLVEFARQTGVLDDERAARLLAGARARRDEAKRVHAETVALRDALYDIFAALDAGQPPPELALAVLNARLARLQLDPRLEWRWAAAPDDLDWPVGPVVRAAVELLTGERRDRVRLCEADDCGFAFLDLSKNRSRRWCDMGQCGNREKARRHHARQKERA